MKLGVQGVTILVSSGDDGATAMSSTGECYCNYNCGSGVYNTYWTGTSWSGYGYFPSFPATSPYVTAVGGTMGPNSGGTEIACQSNNAGGVITTGGGFSTYFETPS